MMTALQPATLEELAEAVRSAPQVIPVGAGTKPRLSAGTGAVAISTARLSGIVEYDPSEFTFTALAGTPLRDIIAALAERGQYLPFDPPFAAAGATLGGTVAAGLNGPGRLRFGGARDFILGVRFVDGDGRLLRLGGKVVKNAAGFDLPKFFVGSLGRFGVLGEITFKVFPRPATTLTVEFTSDSDQAMIALLADLAKWRGELEALEASPAERKVQARLSGPAAALQKLTAELGQRGSLRMLPPDAALTYWQSIDDFSWAHAQGPLCKIPLTLARLEDFLTWTRTLPGTCCQIGAAGNVAYLSLPADGDLAAIDVPLQQRSLGALLLRGNGPLWLGVQTDFRVHSALKHALDSANRFPALR